MEIIGFISKQSYSEKDILDHNIYVKMKNEPLHDEDGIKYIPVRNKSKPHFRRSGNGNPRKCIGQSEIDLTHKDVIARLMNELPNNGLNIYTNVFQPDGVKEKQVIFFSGQAGEYKWFSEKGCRIPFDDDCYIEPDIAGRNVNFFSPSAGRESIIIEVIQTHYPEKETFFKLLSLSRIGYLVVFYFILPGNKGSNFNSYSIKDNIINLRSAYYLSQGSIMKNGEEWIRSEKYKSDDAWYSHLTVEYFNYAMNNK